MINLPDLIESTAVSFSESVDAYSKPVQGIGTHPVIGTRETEELLVKAMGPAGLEGDEIVELLNGLSDPANAQLVLDVSRSTRRPRDREVFLLPPLYFSSICENCCAYCDFSTGGGVRLTLDEFNDEVNSLLAMGYRSIELVSSQDPELFVRCGDYDPADQRFDLSGVVRYFESLRRAISANGDGMITSNIPPVCTKGFTELKSAGLDCFLIWLETFDPDQYARLHVGPGPKAHQAFRLDAFDRAFAAGIEHVAGGFLKGLHDWRKEEAVLYLLDRYLQDRWGRGFSIIGTPRVKGRFLGSMMIADTVVDDNAYELNIALDRLLFDGILWLQTRESFELNRRLINAFGGGVILTLTCCTAPGGYSRPAEAPVQFPSFSENHRQTVAQLEQDGLTVRYAWNAHDLARCRRSRTGSNATL